MNSFVLRPWLVLLISLVWFVVAVSLTGRYLFGDELVVLTVWPAARTVGAPAGTPITITFDQPLNPATIGPPTFMLFGRWSGPAGGNYSFNDDYTAVTLTPEQPFSAGEQVMVVLSNQIQAANGAFLRPAGYTFQFWVATTANNLPYQQLATLSTRTIPNQTTRAYGGVATDFNDDGWLDLSIVNEDTADVRVFLNTADGSGLFHDFLEPPTPVNDRASPSELADFNQDGLADLAVVNIDTNSVSVLLGNGDGTFAQQQEILTGSQPRGIVVLDADGDGDADIVNTNTGGVGNLALMLNDGNGSFSAPTFFEGGVGDEWAIAAGDMNEDGILDLVVGGQSNPNPMIAVVLGNGDGTFSFFSSTSAGGAVWMLNVGDVNGDGHDDVATANSQNNNGAILLGDGNGNLTPPTLTPTDPFPLATDLGDVDGDGDLDWVTSSFSDDWLLFLNNGQGQFTFHKEFNATQAASCALMLDFDNDGDLDLALIDEIADEVILVENSYTPPPPPPVFLNFIPFMAGD